MRLQVLVPDPPVMLVGEQLTVRPVDGLMLVVRLTVEVKPFLGVIVTVKLPVFPWGVIVRIAVFMV